MLEKFRKYDGQTPWDITNPMGHKSVMYTKRIS